MFELFDSGPRTWKWAVPGFFFCVLLWLSIVLVGMKKTDWAAGSIILGLFALAMALTNWWRLVTEHNEKIFEQHQNALSLTPLVLLSNNMRTMHPEAVKVLNRFGVRTSWQVRVDANRGQRDWVLADTNVHFGFIEFVLSRSGKGLYPKNRFSEGSRKWDPDGLVDDREQYAEFENWLFSRLMITRSHGEFRPAEFIPPWTPELIRETLGLTGEQELYQPDEDKTVKQLPAEKDATRGPVLQAKKDDQVRDLTEEALRAIEEENARYAGMYGDGKLPS